MRTARRRRWVSSPVSARGSRRLATTSSSATSLPCGAAARAQPRAAARSWPALGGPLQRFARHANLISRQFLLDAVAGEFSESLADLVSAIAVSDARMRVVSARRVVRIGHSSGADALDRAAVRPAPLR